MMSTATTKARTEPTPEVLQIRAWACEQVRAGRDLNRLPTPSPAELQARYGDDPQTASSPAGRVEVALREHFEGANLEAARQAFDEYREFGSKLSRNGVGLADYVTSGLVDLGVGMPPKVAEVLAAEQEAFGHLRDATNLMV